MTDKKKQEIVRLFKKVQNIPYFLLKHRDSRRLFKLRKGSCAEKVIWLGKKLNEMNIPIKYFLIRFRWQDLPISKEILKLMKKSSGYHLVLKAKINNKWIYIDPTWDLKLEKRGFPVTKNWNGETNTKLAVKPKNIKEFKPKDPSDTNLNRKFIEAFNLYLEKARKSRF